MDDILTNKQRPYFGLQPINSEWENREVETKGIDTRDGQYKEYTVYNTWYLNANKLVKKISRDLWSYNEVDYNLALDDAHEYIMPCTPKGKKKKLNAGNIDKCKTIGFSFYSRILIDNVGNNNVTVVNHNNGKSLVKIKIKGMNSFQDLKKWIHEYIANCAENYLEIVQGYFTQKKIRIRYNHGDVFAIKLEDGRYMFGRVLMVVKRQCCTNKKNELGIVNKNNLLCEYHSGSIFIEIYKEISNCKKLTRREVLLPGIFVSKYMLDDGSWEIIDNIPVSIEEIDFPEEIVNSTQGFIVIKGELKFTIQKSRFTKEIGKVNMHMFNACGAIGRIALFYLNNEKDNPNGNFYSSDLRFNNHRKDIYKLIGEDIRQSYYKMAKKHGFDLARFYK